MFRTLKDLADSTNALRLGVERGCELISSALEERTGNDVIMARLDALEADMVMREAQADATLMRAETVFKAARSAEERERSHAKKAQAALDLQGDAEGEDPLPEWYLDQLRRGDAEGGGEEGVPAVHSGMESRRETVARLREMKLNGRY